ncbi:MAG: ATPase [Butyricicoccus sp.]|nr:ATPase [Butyricicoccus sp.]
MIFLGCDGGSTKTEFLIADESGKILAHRIFSGCNYSYLGRDDFASLMEHAISTVLFDAGLLPTDLTGCLFGLPSYGEIPETETEIPAILTAILGPVPFRIVNDAVVGWGGALGGLPGINVVSGTGSIVYGIDPAGNECRVGGWSLLFCDEGSCSWVGREVIRAFTMQADGRLPRTPLYDVIREELKLTRDQYFSEFLQVTCRNDSASLAALQPLALRALAQGDETIRAIYERAADELSRAALAVKHRLEFPADAPVRVSYSGGLFRAGDVVLTPFRKRLEAENCIFCTPRYSPIVGAVAVAAMQHLSPEKLTVLLDTVSAVLTTA